MVYGRSAPKSIAWAQCSCSFLVQGEIEDFLRSIEVLPSVAPHPGQTRRVPEQAVSHDTTNAKPDGEPKRLSTETFESEGAVTW